MYKKIIPRLIDIKDLFFNRSITKFIISLVFILFSPIIILIILRFKSSIGLLSDKPDAIYSAPIVPILLFATFMHNNTKI